MPAIERAEQAAPDNLPKAAEVLTHGEGAAGALLRALPAAVYACDAEGRITFCNDAAADLWGRRPRLGEDRWSDFWTFFSLDGAPLPPQRSPMGITLREGRSVRGMEIIIERPDGVRRRVLPSPEPLRDESGALTGAVNVLLDVTDRSRGEEAQALLAAIVESSEDAIVSKTLDGEILSWNAGAERIFGYTAGEAIGRPVTLIIPDDRIDEERRILGHLRRGERVQHYETVRLAKDGRRVDVSVTVSPILDAGGQVVAASKVARDITQRKRAEEALRRSEQDLSDFFENATIGLHWISPHGIILRANRAELRMLGYAAHEYVGRPLADFHADRVAVADILDRLRAAEDLIDYPAILRCKDGGIRHVRISSSARWENGAFVHTRCFTRDVTAEVLAQRALQESERQLRTLLALLPVGVYSCDADGRITFFNRRAAALWGREPDLNDPRERFCACSRSYLPDGSPLPPERTPIALAIMRGRSSRDAETLVERPDGSRFHASISADPICDASGRVLGAIGVLQDITDQVRAREALRDQHALLEEAVAERTRELEESHRLLRLSERMASLGTLSAGLGHDVGNLLLPVRISLEALSAADLPEASRADVERIRTSTQYLQQLAGGLRMLALDPLRAGAADPANLRDWWQVAHAIVCNALPQGVALEVDIPDGCRVMMSQPALTQAVFNLVQNAGDALRARAGGRVRIAARRRADRVLLSVEDDGPGMTPQVRDRCMEPFFTTKTRSISTGLGLVLVAGLVRDAGGAVHLSTSPGEGAIFTLDLPAADSAAPGAPARGRAIVHIRDPRLHAIVAAELDHLAFEVLDEPQPPDAVPHLAVLDHPPADLRARRILLLAEPADHPPHITAVGAKPSVGALRRALRAAAQLAAEGPAQ